MIIVYGSRREREKERHGEKERQSERERAARPAQVNDFFMIQFLPHTHSQQATLLGSDDDDDDATRQEQTICMTLICACALGYAEIEQTLIRGSRAVAPLYQLPSANAP